VGGYQLLDAKLGKIQLKIAEKITGVASQPISKMIPSILTNSWIISVTENDLAFEIFAVMPQFVLYCGELGVKFVCFSRSGHMQIAVA